MSAPASTKPRKGGKRPQNFHRSKHAYTLDVAQIMSFSEEEAEAEFSRIRFASSGGFPKCLKCGCESTTSFKRWNPSHTTSRTIYKCKMCRTQFTATSGTKLSYRKLTFKKILIGIAMFARTCSGFSSIDLSDFMKCDFRTAHIFGHKLRNAMRDDIDFRDGPLDGVVEADLTEIGGYIRPKNLRSEKTRIKLVLRKRTTGSIPFADQRENMYSQPYSAVTTD